MGNFFTSSQIYNNENLDKQQFIDKFCKAIADSGYEVCDSDESEKSYILRFATNSKWVAIASEEYGQNGRTAQSEAGRIAKMLGTYCMNTEVIDSDCAAMSLYSNDGKEADMLLMGRYDDYFGDDIPEPKEKIWTQFLSDGSTWEQFMKILSGEYVFVEDGLAQLAPVIGMDSSNLLFSAEDYADDELAVFLDFKKTGAKKKLTINSAFKQIMGKALEPYGFKVIKGRQPYIVRVINNEILHIITFYPENPTYPYDKAITIACGVATIYRKRISLDLTPKQNRIWLNFISNFQISLMKKKGIESEIIKFDSRYYSNDTESMITALKEGAENVIKYVLPVFDEVKDIDSCLDFVNEFKQPRNRRQCTKICNYYPDEDEAFLNFLSEKVIAERPDFLEKYLNDTEFHDWILAEIEKRKTENTEILRKLGLLSDDESKENSLTPLEKLTLKSAFTKVFGEALEPLGFKKVKSRYPYYARLVNDEIIHVITIVSRPDNQFEILGGIATLYRQKLSLDISPKYNEAWLRGNHWYSWDLNMYGIEMKHERSKILEFYSGDHLEKEIYRSLNVTKDIMLNIFDKVDTIEKCIYFYDIFGMDIRIHHMDDFGNHFPVNYYNEGLLIVKSMNMEQYSSLMDKHNERVLRTKMSYPTYQESSYDQLVNECVEYKEKKCYEYKKIISDAKWLKKLDIELNKRQENNIKLLQEYKLM